MGMPDRFYRQGRDIVNKFVEIRKSDPAGADEYLNEKLRNVRDVVKKHVLYKIKMEHTE